MHRFKQLSFTDRLRIETHAKEGKTPQEIAESIGVHISTIYRELKRGRYRHINSDLTTAKRYSPDIAEERYREKACQAAQKFAKDSHVKLNTFAKGGLKGPPFFVFNF